MKVVQQVYITRPDAFLDQANADMGLNLFGDTLYKPDGWVHCGEITLNLDVDVADLTKTVIATLKNEVQKEIAESASRQFSLNRRIDELLALPAPSDEYEDTVYNNDESEDDIADRENNILDAQERR